MNLQNVADGALLSRLKVLVGREREDTAEIIAHLAEVDSRDLAVKRAFPSLFAYCVRELGYSEPAAYYRIRAARAIRKFPEVLGMLRTGALSLESVVRLHPHLAGPDAARLLESVAGKSAREIEALLAGLSPHPDTPDVARHISAGRQRLCTSPPSDSETPWLAFGSNGAEPTRPATAQPPAASVPPHHAEPRSTQADDEARRVRFSFCAGEDVLILLRRAQELLRHKFPTGRYEDVVREALTCLLQKRDPDRRLLGVLPSKAASSVR